MSVMLNKRAIGLVQPMLPLVGDLRGTLIELDNGGQIVDLGVKAEGSLEAGRFLAEVCLSGLAEVWIVPGEIGEFAWPQVQVVTDWPVEACLLSQYAGWRLSVDKFFAMGSGAMRAAAAREELFHTLNYRESPSHAVGALETGKLPTAEVFALIAEKTGVPADMTVLLAARTASIAGNFQVVARSVETSLHKLFELGFDVWRIRSAVGIAPLPPVAKDDFAGIGRTNDAILYGGRVTLMVRGDDESIAAIGPKVPSSSSAAHGKPFAEIFEDAGRDFYKIDPHLFSPAEVVFQNLDTGRVHCFGQVAPDVLRRSFGL
ncbi:MAG: methenyltetrahydromethanopterin cyclohydrolase [Planctomycetes bacterium]|nr:methenyltetrahydromethanopterin cyclohydrolase [Planctomycetota bacterium]